MSLYLKLHQCGVAFLQELLKETNNQLAGLPDPRAKGWKTLAHSWGVSPTRLRQIRSTMLAQREAIQTVLNCKFEPIERLSEDVGPSPNYKTTGGGRHVIRSTKRFS